MSLYKKNILFIVIFTLCAFVSVPAFVWIVDPFHVYHRDTWINRGKTLGGGSLSLKNGSIIKSACLNGGIGGVLCGGCVSHSANMLDFKRSTQSKKPFIHLYTLGAYVNLTHLEMLQEALKKSRNIEHVVLLNPQIVFSMFPPWDFGRWELFYHPERTIFEKNAILSAMFMVLHHLPFLKPLRPPEQRHLWPAQAPEVFFKSAAQWRKITVSNVICNDKFQGIINNPLLSLIRENPNITFHLLFFPINTPIVGSTAKIYLGDPLFYIEGSKSFSNVKIYAFHDVPHVCIPCNWEDGSVHFSPVFNKFMPYCIEHDLHRVTAENYEAYKQHILDVLKSFNTSDYPDRPTTFEELVAYEESLHPELKKQKVEKE